MADPTRDSEPDPQNASESDAASPDGHDTAGAAAPGAAAAARPAAATDTAAAPTPPEVADDPDLPALLAALAETEADFAAWQARIDQAFKAHIDPVRAFNEGRPSDFLPGIMAASQAARRDVGVEPETRTFAFLDVFCEHYLGAPDDAREAMRRAVAASPTVAGRITWYIGRSRRLLESSGDERWLRLSLAAASLSDLRTDYRDMYLSLGELYLAGLRGGIEPGPAFGEAARLSSDDPNRFGKSSMRDFLGRFERSAYLQSIGRKVAEARAEGRRRLPGERRRPTPPASA